MQKRCIRYMIVICVTKQQQEQCKKYNGGEKKWFPDFGLLGDESFAKQQMKDNSPESQTIYNGIRIFWHFFFFSFIRKKKKNFHTVKNTCINGMQISVCYIGYHFKKLKRIPFTYDI